MEAASALAPLLSRLIGSQAAVAIQFWDGSTHGPADAKTQIVVRSPAALRRITRAPGELGFSRAYVAGELDVNGDVFEALRLRDLRPDLSLGWGELLAAVVGALRLRALLGRASSVAEEARLRGRRHSRARDAAAIAHHYDVSNDFYRTLLGESMTYSCAYFSSPRQPLSQAQRDKHELICRKLALRPDQRMLDVGCGWGTLAIHAASKHGVRVVGVTLSQRQAELASKRAAEAGVADRVEIRVQDERDVDDGPFDAISSVGMFEHVGAERLAGYFDHLHSLLPPGGLLLNHGISRPPGAPRPRFAKGSFIDRFVFPDGELHEVGAVISTIQNAGFEVRDVESLREHYALTLRNWVRNLEVDQQAAVAAAGEGRYRVWRLYIAASALNFEEGRTQVHQVLAVKASHGASGLPLRRDGMILFEDAVQ